MKAPHTDKKTPCSFFLFFSITCFVFLFSAITLAGTKKISPRVFQSLLPLEFELLGPEVFRAALKVIQTYEERTADSPAVCKGRLTLTSGTAVTSSNVTAATSIYFTPLNGGKISLYDGSTWQLVSFTETSVSVPATTVTPFDIFAYNNSGTLTLETVDWTNDTTRATALATQNGIVVKNGASTRRYLGTSRTTGVSGQTEDSTSKRFLWNMCNRMPRKVLATSNSDTWAYTTATWRAANADTTTGVTRVEYVVGQQIEPLKLEVYIPSIGTTANNIAVGIGLNSTTVNSADFYGAKAGSYATAYAAYQGVPSLGFSYGQWLEVSAASGTTNWYTYNTGAWRVTALTGEIWQ